jgi:adenylosuccinate lyase
MATENILMAGVALGGDRQHLHDLLRHHSHAVEARLKAGAAKNDLIERLRADPAFGKINFDRVLQPREYAGRAPEQVDEFLSQEVEPVRRGYRQLLNQTAVVEV